MSKQAARVRRVPPTRSELRAELRAREFERVINRYRPATAVAVEALGV